MGYPESEREKIVINEIEYKTPPQMWVDYIKKNPSEKFDPFNGDYPYIALTPVNGKL